MRAIQKLGAVKADAIYVKVNGVTDPFPAAANVEVTLPEITHPTYTTQSTGDMEIPDQTRVNSMTTTISAPTGGERIKLSGEGVQEYIIRFALEVEQANGLFEIRPFTAYISGIIAQRSGQSLTVGDVPSSEITINTFKYRLLEGDKELYNIDKLAGIVRINGVDYRARLNEMV